MMFAISTSTAINSNNAIPTSIASNRNAEHPEGGFMMIESMGSMLFYLIMIASAAILIGLLMSGGKLSEMEQGLSGMRMQIQQLYTGSIDYSGLDNSLAMKSGVVPKRFRRGDNILSPWGGDITLATGSDVGTFTISIASIPQEECTKLATYQVDSWEAIDVNSSRVDRQTSVASAAGNCSTTNTIVYTSR